MCEPCFISFLIYKMYHIDRTKLYCFLEVSIVIKRTMSDREVSGLLISVIRTLHETDTGEREEEKKKLELQFKVTEKKYNEKIT